MRNSLAEARGAREASETSVIVISKRQSVASEQGMGYTFIMRRSLSALSIDIEVFKSNRNYSK